MEDKAVALLSDALIAVGATNSQVQANNWAERINNLLNESNYFIVDQEEGEE